MNIIDTMNYSNKDLIESLFIQIENDLGYHIINKLSHVIKQIGHPFPLLCNAFLAYY